MERKFRLRCRMDYSDGRIWRGQWDKSGDRLSDMAAGQPREGLVSVCIEAKDLSTTQISEVVRCSADHFRRFQWFAVARSPSTIRGEFTVTGIVYGLTIETEKERVTAYVDGTTHIENIEV